jgi:hypothetical protein
VIYSPLPTPTALTEQIRLDEIRLDYITCAPQYPILPSPCSCLSTHRRVPSASLLYELFSLYITLLPTLDRTFPEMPAYVTMLRLLVNPDPLSKDTFLSAAHGDKGVGESERAAARDHSVKVLKRDLKRAKWLDDATTDLGLVR